MECLVRQVLSIGDSLREAQSDASGDALRELSKQRRQVFAAVVTTTRELAATLRDLGANIDALEETPDRLVCAAFTPGDDPVGHVAMYLGAAGQDRRLQRRRGAVRPAAGRRRAACDPSDAGQDRDVAAPRAARSGRRRRRTRRCPR